jgi:ArsR family transcriptional regulator, arsenate/arsenite/antimonite-responsive transcriptional repressor
VLTEQARRCLPRFGDFTGSLPERETGAASLVYSFNDDRLSDFTLRTYFENIRRRHVISKVEHHADQLAALGHPVRLAILRFVVQGGERGSAAGEIQSHVDLPASTLSHHLKRLVEAEMLISRQEGTFHYYAADYESLLGLTNYLWQDCCKRGGKTTP